MKTSELGSAVSRIVNSKFDRFVESVDVVNLINSILPINKNSNQFSSPNRRSRFLNKIVFGMSECWYWRAYINEDGYGKFEKQGAHRASYQIHIGEIPKGMKVLHKCDVRNCVNPDHLFLGTQQDNMDDMIKKGRHRTGPKKFGEKNPMSKLTKDDVFKMREIKEKNPTISCQEIAADFGVSKMAAYRAITKRSWSHI